MWQHCEVCGSICGSTVGYVGALWRMWEHCGDGLFGMWEVERQCGSNACGAASVIHAVMWFMCGCETHLMMT